MPEVEAHEGVSELRKVLMREARKEKLLYRQRLLSVAIVVMVLTTSIYTFTQVVFTEERDPLSYEGTSAEGMIYRQIARLDSMAVLLDAVKGRLDSLSHLQVDTSASVLSMDMKPWQDSLRILSGSVELLNDAITPQSITEIITLQRLGDRYEQLMQSNKDY